ncbi:MAG: hypothetical protein NW223_11025 [Hyphomicrobiaceae bacterium]|nr:hypothetical protein [Hyphomicrobiaceae bacterium]
MRCWRKIVCLLLALPAAGAAHAQEYCIACTDPGAVYRCVIDNAQPGGATPLQTLCIAAMTKAGKHASCAIKRGTVFDCTGPVKRVPWAPVAGEVAPGKAEAVKEPDLKEPPKTVEEMAGRANKKTVEDMKKAGETMTQGAKSVGEGVSNATKKTWECLSSLFSKC